MKQDASFFDGVDPSLVYIARKLNDALSVETLLTEAGFDYGVEADLYRGGFLFLGERTGAFFYVKPEREEAVRDFLAAKGFRLVPKEVTS